MRAYDEVCVLHVYVPLNLLLLLLFNRLLLLLGQNSEQAPQHSARCSLRLRLAGVASRNRPAERRQLGGGPGLVRNRHVLGAARLLGGAQQRRQARLAHRGGCAAGSRRSASLYVHLSSSIACSLSISETVAISKAVSTKKKFQLR